MGIANILGKELKWSEEKIKRSQDFADAFVVIGMIFVAVLAIGFMNTVRECTDIMKATCPAFYTNMTNIFQDENSTWVQNLSDESSQHDQST